MFVPFVTLLCYTRNKRLGVRDRRRVRMRAGEDPARQLAMICGSRDGTWRLLFAPEIWVRPDFTDPPPGLSPAAAREAAASLGADFARARLARRYNSATGRLLAAWVRLLTAGGTAATRTVYAFGLPADAGVDAAFTLGTRPLVSRPLAGAPLGSNT